jgi:hypothetical protein
VFKKIPERVKVVKRIFDWAAEGVSIVTIMHRLNEEKVPTFKGRSHWARSYLRKLVHFKAVLGVYEAHTYKNGKRVFDRAVADYYPAIIEQDLWDRVQTYYRTNFKRRGGVRVEPKSIFAALTKCPRCGSTMSRITKGAKHHQREGYLLCNKAHANAGCQRHYIPVAKLTEAFIAQAGMLLALPPTGNSFDEELRNNEASQTHVGTMLENVTDAITASGGSKVLIEKLATLEAQQRDLVEEARTLKQKQSESAHPVIEKKVTHLKALLAAKTLDVVKVNAALRGLFARIFVGEDGAMHFEWHQGGSTSVTYSMPYKRKRRA